MWVQNQFSNFLKYFSWNCIWAWKGNYVECLSREIFFFINIIIRLKLFYHNDLVSNGYSPILSCRTSWLNHIYYYPSLEKKGKSGLSMLIYICYHPIFLLAESISKSVQLKSFSSVGLLKNAEISQKESWSEREEQMRLLVLLSNPPPLPKNDNNSKS